MKPLRRRGRNHSSLLELDQKGTEPIDAECKKVRHHPTVERLHQHDRIAPLLLVLTREREQEGGESPERILLTETNRRFAEKLDLSLDGVCKPGLRPRIICKQVILRAQGQALHARIDRCSGAAGMRLQKAEADKVTGKGKLNYRTVAVPARLVNDKRAGFHCIKMSFRIADAEQ
jgi:hypothetical protein